MPGSRPLGTGFLQRPLLQFKNSALRNYLRENKTGWTEDPSNLFLNHDRNFMRHEVIPLLQQRWPEVSQRLLLTREAMTDTRYLLEELADEYLGPNLIHPFILRVTPKCRTNPELLRLVIRRWIKHSGATGIPVYKLDSFCKQVQHANSESKVSVRWDDWILRCYKSQLWLQTTIEILPCATVSLRKGQTDIDLGRDAGQLVLGTGTPSGDHSEPGMGLAPEGEFSVRGRINTKETGISLGGHHKSLKNLFQSADIPPWLRDAIPLCKLDDELVAMGDWCFNERFASWLSENRISLSWRPRHPLLQFILKQQHRAKH